MDHSGTTPIDPAVLEAMMPYLTKSYANPSSLYTEAREVRIAIDEARQQVADAVALFGKLLFGCFHLLLAESVDLQTLNDLPVSVFAAAGE